MFVKEFHMPYFTSLMHNLLFSGDLSTESCEISALSSYLPLQYLGHYSNKIKKSQADHLKRCLQYRKKLSAKILLMLMAHCMSGVLDSYPCTYSSSKSFTSQNPLSFLNLEHQGTGKCNQTTRFCLKDSLFEFKHCDPRRTTNDSRDNTQ
jgi:hypothetical protein